MGELVVGLGGEDRGLETEMAKGLLFDNNNFGTNGRWKNYRYYSENL